MKFGACIVSAVIFASAVQAGEMTLVAAGSLKTALGVVVGTYSDTYGASVATRFGPSGLMRESIEAGEPADVFASANMRHPKTLEVAGVGGPVVLFARNRLCAIARPEVTVTAESLLDVILSPDTRLGTSTPGADPSGDYAWAFFEKTGHGEVLKEKALQLTGGADSAKAPKGQSTYGWILDSNQADVFVTYCTNAVLARAEYPELQQIALPESLAVGADYGLIVLNDAPPSAWHLAAYILSEQGQTVLREYGFSVSGIPTAQ